ncbi:MAG: cyclodeaminase/cyclohydrolase family protein, partial [Bacteroidales bacterium]|nr:cyclodeaminase/cyclohydrolase family protein [Bacteroidales bacterium]
EKAIRSQAIQDATKYAIEIPFKTMQICYNSMEVMLEMAKTGLEASVSDAAVGAIAARAGVQGGFLNVRINAGSFKDKDFINKLIADGQDIENKALALEKEILDIVLTKI